MTVDKMRIFTALQRFDVRTARSAFVDSPEQAIAFATRRNAADDRAIAIVLRAVPAVDSKAGSPGPPVRGDEAVRAAYTALRAELPEETKILAQDALPRGTDIVVLGEAAPGGQTTVEMLGLGHSARSGSVHATRMLEHLEQRLANLMAKAHLRRLELDVRLHDNSYTVTDATAQGWTPVEVQPRLEHGDHDRSAAGMKGHESWRREEKPAGPLYDPARLGGNEAERR